MVPVLFIILILAIPFCTACSAGVKQDGERSAALKQEGERCGSCYCPPTYTAGECAPGLECKHDPMISDAPGKCVRPNAIVTSNCEDKVTWCSLADCRLNNVKRSCQKSCNVCP